MKNLQIFFAILIFFGNSQIYGQSDPIITEEIAIPISGKVTDGTSGDPILFGSVALYKDSILIGGRETDLDGNYKFTVNEFGTYEIEVNYTGYQPQRITGIKLDSLEGSIIDITITESMLLNEVIIVCYRKPLIKIDQTTSGTTVTAKKIKSLPTRSINAIASSIAGISTGDSKRKKKNKNNVTSSTDPTMNTEEYSKITENEFINPKDEALSTFSIDVDRASYSNVRRFINNSEMPPKDAVRIEEMINYFPYDYDTPENDMPFAVEHNLTDCPWNPKTQILHIGIQGEKIDKSELPATNLVFLIDVSGSMSSWNKLDLVKSSLNLLVDNMREKDKIALVVYAGSAGLVLPSTSGKNKLAIKEAINNLSSGGSTAGGAGINLAYKVAKENFIDGGNNRVILATDGDFNVGVSDEGSLVRMIEEKREDDIFLSILGYGMGNYKDSKMQKLADTGNGNHSYIDNIEEAKKTLIDEFGGTLFTIAKDVKIQIEFNPEFVKSYKLIGYENRLLDKQDFNNDKKDAGELGAGHSVTAFYEIEPQTTFGRETTSVDKLKYQETTSINNTSDLATIKLRYKRPTGRKSQLIEEVITPSINEEISDDIQFALCVAEFAMLLRQSNAVKDSSYEELLLRANTFVENDDWGYRTDFASLIENVIRINESL